MTAPAEQGGTAPVVVRLGAVDSTQAVAFSLAEGGAPDGTVVLADPQKAGRGRRGRVWHDEVGLSLLVSIVLRPRLEVPRLPRLSIAAGVAVACVLERVGGVTARLKWPNDVLVRGRKIAGILLESRIRGPETAADGPPGGRATVVIGIGINLLQTTFPDDLRERATSLLRETGRACSSQTLLAALIHEMDRWRTPLEGGDFEPVRQEWLRRADTIGQRVATDAASGIAVDLDADGALVLEENGRRVTVTAGDIDAARR